MTAKLKERAENQIDEDDFLDDDLDDEMDEDSQSDRYMTFQINDQGYGVEILHVTEIVGLHDIAVVPDVPHYVKGMMNLRGNVVPVIDVRLRFGLPERDYDDRTCVIVVTIENSTVGMIVDRVNEVASFPEDHISPAPQASDGSQASEFIEGLGKQGEDVTILLNTERLLHGSQF